MDTIAIAFVLIVAHLVFFWWVSRVVYQHHLFRYDDHNPARRWCRKCNQLQEMYTRGYWTGHDSWWEDMLPIPNPECRCHRHAR